MQLHRLGDDHRQNHKGLEALFAMCGGPKMAICLSACACFPKTKLKWVAYEFLNNGADNPRTVLLRYPDPDETGALLRAVPNPMARAAGSGKVPMAMVGAGGFAKLMHLPNLQALLERSSGFWLGQQPVALRLMFTRVLQRNSWPRDF